CGCGSPVSGIDWHNLTSASRDQVDRSSDRRPRTFTYVGGGPKCGGAGCSCKCAIASGECCASGRESTSDGQCRSSKFISSSSGGCSTASTIKRATGGRCNT